MTVHCFVSVSEVNGGSTLLLVIGVHCFVSVSEVNGGSTLLLVTGVHLFCFGK